MDASNPKTVLFVTGSFVGNNCWDAWANYFQQQGYETQSPPWPFKEGDPASLRDKHPLGNPGLASLSLAEVIDHYAGIAQRFARKPVIIGHSMGGLITQILVNRGLAAAGIAIHPVPPMGVIPIEFSFYKAGWKGLGLFSSLKKTYMMSFRDWQYAFVNGMPMNEQREAYETYTIPESYRVTRGALGKAAKIDFKKPHAPLLIVSGSTDHIIPASLNKRNFEKYRKANSGITEYRDMPGRNHFVLGQSTWKEDAQNIRDWIEKQFLPAAGNPGEPLVAADYSVSS